MPFMCPLIDDNLSWSFISPCQFGQWVWLWSSPHYQPLSFLPSLSIDGMIIESWHVWELRPFPSGRFWTLNVSSSWSNRREEDNLRSWHNLCTAATPPQLEELIRNPCEECQCSWICLHIWQGQPLKETWPIWPCKVGEILTLVLFGRCFE